MAQAIYNELTGEWEYPEDNWGAPPSNPWTDEYIADLAGGELGGLGNGNQGNPPPTTPPTTGNNINPWYDHSQEPPWDPGRANGFHWAWNGSMWEIRDGNGGNGTVTGPGNGRSGGGGYPSFQLAPFGGGSQPFPMLDLPTMEPYADFVPDEWKAPDPSAIKDDPTYSWRFDEGLRPIRNSRAAAGLTRTGATLKELSRYGQNFASNEYDRVYSRAADSYDRNNAAKYQAWSGNRQNRLDTYDRNVNELNLEFQPKQTYALAQYQREWDAYKYAQDDAFRRWAKEGDWANGLTNLGD